MRYFAIIGLQFTLTVQCCAPEVREHRQCPEIKETEA